MKPILKFSRSVQKKRRNNARQINILPLPQTRQTQGFSPV